MLLRIWRYSSGASHWFAVWVTGSVRAYLAQYNAAGGDINRMRRVNYAKNKERINAQKRAAYEARKTREDQ